MIGPELQAAIYDALTGAGVAGGRVYDRVPKEPVFPYVTIGDGQVINDGGDDGDQGCVGGWEAYEDVHIWSRPETGSKAELKTLTAAAVAALRSVSVVPGFTVISANLETSRAFRDPDGITEHGVVTMRFVLSPVP